MIEEIWKDIPGYDGYQASNLGNIKSLYYRKRIKDKINPKIMSKVSHTGGYLRVNIKKDGEEYCKDKYIQSLIALAFLGEMPDGYEVNHIDGNKHNNNIDNLEYVTHKENLHHAIKIKGNWQSTAKKTKQRHTNLTQQEIIFIQENRYKIKPRELSEIFKVNLQTIYQTQNCRTYKSKPRKRHNKFVVDFL